MPLHMSSAHQPVRSSEHGLYGVAAAAAAAVVVKKDAMDDT